MPDIASTYVNVALPEAFAVYAESLERAPADFSPGVRARLEIGGRISRDEYVKAQADRAAMRTAVDAALAGCDVLALPTVPLPPQKVGASAALIAGVEEPLRGLTLRLTQLFNLTGHPAISLPSADTSTGLPCGLQLIGRRNQTVDLLEAALSCESCMTPRAPSSSGPL